MHGDSLEKHPLIPALLHAGSVPGSQELGHGKRGWVIQNISLLLLLPSALLQAEAQRSTSRSRSRALKSEAAESLLWHQVALAP